MITSEAPVSFFKQMFAGSWITQGIWVAAELGIADCLSEGPQGIDIIAQEVNADPKALYRLMRALTSVNLFSMDSSRRFGLTPVSELLQTGHPASQRAFSIMMGSEFYAAWGELLHSVRTGEPGFDKRFGKHFFEYMQEQEERHSIYDQAMVEVHGPETGPMIEAYDFGQFNSMVDIGGGNGMVLSSILQNHEHLKGILFDLPAVVDRARESFATTQIHDRIEFHGGSFFSTIPPGIDAYLMRHVIHDWQDTEAISILRNVHAAMNADSRVLVVEMVIPPDNNPSFSKWLDLMMLLVGGRERTEGEYAALFASAGLELNRVIPTESEVSILEGIKSV